MTITIVGLGPGAWEQVTLEAKRVFEEAEEVYLRTERHPTVAHLPAHLRLNSFDHLYETSPDFDRLYQAIATEVLQLGRRAQGVIYAVPGHPLMGEASVPLILSAAQAEEVPVRVVAGLSFLEPTLTLLKLDPITHGLQIVDAHQPRLDPTRPALVAQLYHQRLAAELKLDLLDLYPQDHNVTLIRAAGVPGMERVHSIPLHLLDREAELDHLTSLYLPPLAQEEHHTDFSTLVHIMAKLRSPEGCPWDRKQTHSSLKPHLLQECYEALEALDEDDHDKLCEELGDLLMHIVLHAQIGAEAGEFQIGDVLRSINAKLLRRHPHVFGDVQVTSAAEVSHRWQEIKQEERGGEESLLASVPQQMPALAYSQAIQDRASGSGFDWQTLEGVLGKLSEELSELERSPSHDERLKEFGDVLFTMVNVARWLGLDAEEALRLANKRFLRRFQRMEKLSLSRGQPLAELSTEAMNRLWDEVKAEEADQ